MAKQPPQHPLAELNEAIMAHDADAVVDAATRFLSQGTLPSIDPKSIAQAIHQAAASGNYQLVMEQSEQYASRLRADAVNYPKTFASELKRAVDRFDRDRAAELCQQLIDAQRSGATPYALPDQERILSTLQRKRYFDLMIQVGDTLIMHNGAVSEADSAETQSGKLKLRRRYAQALIEGGQLSAALAVLAALKHDCIIYQKRDELAEANGLIGRAQKQFYMDFVASSQHTYPTALHQQSLSDAVAAYDESYQLDSRHIWHGINTVALVERAARDRVALSGKKWDSQGTAQAVLSHIVNKQNQATLWDFATAAEACLALSQYDQALEWVTRYTHTSEADAFEYASTLRQFEDVWQLDETQPDQAKILQLLRSTLLEKEGGEIELRDLEQELQNAETLSGDAQFEKVLGQDRYKTYRWYVTGLERSTAVAKILDRSENGIGTGFLVKGSDLHPSITEDWVLVTNAHVISDEESEQNGTPNSLPPEDATIVFQAGPNADKRFSVKRLIFSSSRTDLDCTVVSLVQTVSFDKPFRISKRLPTVNPNNSQRVYVIGHPKGGSLSFSLHDNILLDHQAPKVHYRAPTEGGSSGSPVFNTNWDLVALHHLGGEAVPRLNNQPGVYSANEGIAFDNILRAIARELD